MHGCNARTTEALFVLRRMQVNCKDEEKNLYMRFLDIEKAFDEILRKVVK